MFLAYIPYRQGNTDTRIITFGTRTYFFGRHKHLCQPFFDHRFTITPGDADDRYIELGAMQLTNLLQCLDAVGNDVNMGIWPTIKFLQFFFRNHIRLYNEMANSFLV